MNKTIKQLIFVLFFCFAGSFLRADAADYTTLRKFISARMYGEAYNELLRQEISSNEIDPKLQKLKKDLLDRTTEKLEKQAKISPDDPAVFTILADIAFQKGDYDNAAKYSSAALKNKGGAISHYVFAKILFRKGQITQAYDEMGLVLEAMPGSSVIFDDFTFLYSCNQYGVATAKKLTKNCNFLVRATPLAYEGEDLDTPESPFENDPTAVADSPDFGNYERISKNKTSEIPNPYDLGDDEPNTENLAEDVDFLAKEQEEKPASKKENKKPATQRPTPMGKSDEKVAKKPAEEPLPDEIADHGHLFTEEDDFSDFDDMVGEGTEVASAQKTSEPEVEEKEEKEVDPELAKIEEAERLLKAAKVKFKNQDYEDAKANLRRIDALKIDFGGQEEKEELEKKIDYKFELAKRYKEAKEQFEEGEFDKTLKTFRAAYNDDPKKYRDAPYYIGKCYVLKEDPDKEAAVKYFDILLEDKDIDPEMSRDLRWTKLEIFYEQGNYEQAEEIFDDFCKNEEAFTKEQTSYKELYYGLIMHGKWGIYILIGLGIAFTAIIIVFMLMLLPDLTTWGRDPLQNARKAMDEGKLDKAIKSAEKGLQKKQPIQIERQLREILVQAYFDKENFEKCQEHGKAILRSFPDNNIAWAFLAKASVAISDTSNEAVKMYEKLYKEDPSKKEYLPLLAHHYATTKNSTPAAMELLYDYYRMAPDDSDVIVALAEGYVKNRTMEADIIPIMNNAIAIKDKIEFRELLARTFSKAGMYNEAARECVNVLERNINNIGIHVVYTSSMKKQRKLNEAIEQYKSFVVANPGNSQLIEILNGLKKEAVDTSTLVDDVPKMSDDLPMPDLPEPGMADTVTDDDVANFVEPPPEGFEQEQQNEVPLPKFMQDQVVQEDNNLPEDGGLPTLPDNIETMDPFADNDELFDGFDTELPEELGGTARAPVETSKSLDNIIDEFNNKNIENDIPVEMTLDPFGDIEEVPQSTRTSVPDTAENTGVLELGAKVEEAKELIFAKKWDDAIALLTPEFASQRNRDAGMLLVDAWLGKKKPQMANEIIQTLDFDPEIMPENIKDALYRTAVALEMDKKYSDALHLYDVICNSDINYRDAFDRSDKLYARMKG